MRRVFQTISWLALAATILPAVLFCFDAMTLDQAKLTMLLATIGWFVHTPLWMGRAKSEAAPEMPARDDV